MAARKKKQEGEPYTFSELSAKAKAVAIEQYRDKNYDRLFDYDDAQFLTETFEQDLKDHYGLGDLEAHWSLGYCQGDGVCFEGTVDIASFIKAEKQEERFGPLIGLVHAKITHESRYCHWNSMTVEVGFDGNVSPVDLLPEELRLAYEDWNARQRSRERVRMEAEYARREPIRFWQRQLEEWREEMARRLRNYTKQDWTPRLPEPPVKPEEGAEIPVPPALVIPEDLKAALDAAAQEFERLEKKVTEFEEYLTARVKEISKELEKNGYDEIDYHRTDEYIAERLADDDQEYNRDGSLYDED